MEENQRNRDFQERAAKQRYASMMDMYEAQQPSFGESLSSMFGGAAQMGLGYGSGMGFAKLLGAGG